MSLEAGSVRAQLCGHTAHLGWVPSPDRTALTCNATKRLPLATSSLLALKTTKRKHRIIFPELQPNFSPSLNKIKPTIVPTRQPEVELPPLFPRLPGLSPSEEQPTPGPGPEGRPPPSLRGSSPPSGGEGKAGEGHAGPSRLLSHADPSGVPRGRPSPGTEVGLAPGARPGPSGPCRHTPPHRVPLPQLRRWPD